MYQVNLIMRVQVLSSFVERSFYFDTKTKSIPTFNYLKKLLTLPLSKQKDFFFPLGATFVQFWYYYKWIYTFSLFKVIFIDWGHDEFLFWKKYH